MRLIAFRGANTVASNEADAILDATEALIHQEIKLFAFDSGEVGQDIVGGILPSRRPTDAEAYPQVVPAAQACRD